MLMRVLERVLDFIRIIIDSRVLRDEVEVDGGYLERSRAEVGLPGKASLLYSPDCH